MTGDLTCQWSHLERLTDPILEQIVLSLSLSLSPSPSLVLFSKSRLEGAEFQLPAGYLNPLGLGVLPSSDSHASSKWLVRSKHHIPERPDPGGWGALIWREPSWGSIHGFIMWPPPLVSGQAPRCHQRSTCLICLVSAVLLLVCPLMIVLSYPHVQAAPTGSVTVFPTSSSTRPECRLKTSCVYCAIL